MTLISLAITVALVFSWAVQLGLIQADAIWWELATLVTIMLLGHWIEMRSISLAEGALQEMAKLLPDTAIRVTDAGEETVPVGELLEGDIVLLRPGASVPADGVVRKGTSDLDEAMIIGESRSVRKTEGDAVIAATINGAGSLRIEVTGTGEKTMLSAIMLLVADAQRSKSRVQNLADRAARILTLVAIGAGVLTLVVWHFLGAPLDFSIVRVVTVLVIACPHALGLAVRLVAAIRLVRGGQVLAVFAVADAIREESRQAIRALHDRSIEVAMLTGDAQAVADAVAEELGIDTVLAQVLPGEKASKVRELQGRGRTVAMVGDGVNDAPALATADIGIAIGAGTDVAVEAGHIVLVRSDPRDAPRIVDLSRATYRKMVQNLWWAAGYNVFAIPLAAGVLHSRGVVLTPAVGAVLMSASTVIVAINAQLLKRIRL